MPVDKFRYAFTLLCLVLRSAIAEASALWEAAPGSLHAIIAVVSAIAFVNIIASLVKAVIFHRGSWKKKPDSELMYSFAAGSGQYQRRRIFREAHRYLFDKTWSVFSFAGLAYRMGNHANQARTLLFLCSFFYLPLAVLGMGEMILRCAAGVIFYFAVNLAYTLFLLLLWVLNLALMPLFNLADKASWVTQHCPHCYSSFKLPVFECPRCGTRHTRLYPGNSGLFFARCTCGCIIPCAAATKRKRLRAYCPKCEHALAGASIKALTVQVIGGNSAGKTAFIAAFQHEYAAAVKREGVQGFTAEPEEDFRELENIFQSGRTVKSSGDEVQAYYLLHRGKGSADAGIVLYDVPDELICNEQYERNPLNFAYSDGIVIIIDPLSVGSVRKKCESISGGMSVNGFSDDAAEDIVVHFINKYSEVTGRTAKRMSNTPVAVVIAKTDLTPVRQRVGAVRLKTEYNANRKQYKSPEDARDKLCRGYLSDIGLSNALNNLDSVFARVSFFPVSAIGHTEDGSPFEPQGVLAPMAWLACKCKRGVKDMAAFAREDSACQR